MKITIIFRGALPPYYRLWTRDIDGESLVYFEPDDPPIHLANGDTFTITFKKPKFYEW